VRVPRQHHRSESQAPWATKIPAIKLAAAVVVVVVECNLHMQSVVTIDRVIKKR